MTIALGVIGAICLGMFALVVYRFSIADRNFESLLKATQGLLEETQRERERHTKQTSELLNRIQAPEVAPFVETGEFEKQHVSFDSDEEFWENRSDD